MRLTRSLALHLVEDMRLDTDSTELARCLQEEWLVVMPERLGAALISSCRDALLEILSKHAEVADANRGTSRHQMYLPFEPPFDDEALWGDPHVLAVVERVLGSDFECIYCASDTPMPGSRYQFVHQDCDPLFAEWEAEVPPFSVIVNVPLVDVDDTNGPLEWYRGRAHPAPETVPERFTGPAGTVLLRDPRLWHRGTPNSSAAARPTLALIYARRWYKYHLDPPTIPRSTYERLSDLGRHLFRSANLTPPLDPAKAAGPVEFA